MDHLGLDIAKAKFDAHLIIGTLKPATVKYSASFPNTAAGFEQLGAWLARHRMAGSEELHCCMEATGNWGLDLAAFLYAAGCKVSIVNPKQIKAFGESELSRNKTDKLDAALTARFCIAHAPAAWAPPAGEMRELREMVRRCAALKASRTQEINRQKAGLVSTAVAASIARSLTHIEGELQAITAEIRALVARDAALQANFTLLHGIPGIGETSAALIMAELPNIAEFTPKALAAFAGLSPQQDESGPRRRAAGISRIGNPALRSALYMCALTARRHNPRLAEFVKRMSAQKKPNKVILIAVARKLLVMAHAVVRSQKPFQPETAAA